MIGPLLAIAGGFTKAIGSFYEAQGAKDELKSQALTADMESDIAGINARLAEEHAQSLLQGRDADIARYTMAAGAEKSALRSAQGASGVVLGSGSTARTQATMDLMHEIDIQSLNLNALRAAGAARLQKSSLQGRSLLAGVSAKNMRRSAASINPWAAASTSLIGSATSAAGHWYGSGGGQTA
jgi:hypothetical protein